MAFKDGPPVGNASKADMIAAAGLNGGV